jgi:hypothetical protein
MKLRRLLAFSSLKPPKASGQVIAQQPETQPHNIPATIPPPPANKPGSKGPHYHPNAVRAPNRDSSITRCRDDLDVRLTPVSHLFKHMPGPDQSDILSRPNSDASIRIVPDPDSDHRA